MRLRERRGRDHRARNAARGESDVLLLVGERLREPVAMGGPIVMNYDWEIDERASGVAGGTFLKLRNHATCYTEIKEPPPRTSASQGDSPNGGFAGIAQILTNESDS